MINTLKDAAFEALTMAEEILYDFDSFENLIILFGEEFSVDIFVKLKKKEMSDEQD